MGTTAATPAPKRGRVLLFRCIAVLSAVLILGGIWWISLGPPISTETVSCEVTGEPKVSHTRRNISYSVETSCGKLGLTPEGYFSARLRLEAGESYEFTVENRLFGRRAVAFEAL